MNELFKIFFGIKRRKIYRIKKKPKRKNINYLKYKNDALILVKDRLEYFNQFYNFKYNKITIRNQKTRWGSCSKKGNLNFNYKIALLTQSESDYIIVHELCHTGEFNHSQNFWNLVAETVPDYKEVRGSLRKKGQIEAKTLSGRVTLSS